MIIDEEKLTCHSMTKAYLRNIFDNVQVYMNVCIDEY